MAATMQKLLKKPLQQGVFPYLKPLNLIPSLLHHHPNLDALPEFHNVGNFKTEKEPNTISTPLLQENAALDNGLHVFPSFPFGFFLDPKLSSGFHHIEEFDARKLDFDESRIMWADSVKKKRKKKMNKHKLRKLRKRLRGYA